MKDQLANLINRQCACKTLNTEELNQHLKEALAPLNYAEIIRERPHLFSSVMVFISPDQYRKMHDLIQSVETVVATSFFQRQALEAAPLVAQANPGPAGVYMGYDFHLADVGPQLIEINTNAGGALLNTKLAKAQRDCCIDLPTRPDYERLFTEMFRSEWKLQNSTRPLKTVAIIDENPEAQYLYPEFKLFERLFLQHGIKAFIADPSELVYQNHKLTLNETEIDLIYNRLTDFYWDHPSHQHLKKAYADKAVVVTPNPHHHAIYANKLNLTLLTDEKNLRQWNLEPATRDTLLHGIPSTEKVTAEKSHDLWDRRKELFFKPAHGYGSKAAYRGDKVTKKVWEQILSADYIAQKLVPPSTRIIKVDNEHSDLKVDIRAYVYQGRIQLLAARLYSGQTTNFRTSGGGFAPVFIAEKLNTQSCNDIFFK
jgi:hypothetical protein